MAGESILILEDHEQVRAALGDSLSASGYRIRVFADSEAAFAELTKRPPDLLLVDIQLAAADRGGLDFLKSVRAVDPYLPAIIVSGKDTKDNLFEAGRLGAHTFLTKGAFGEEDLLAAIEDALRRFENSAVPASSNSALDRLLGQSRPMLRLKAQIKRFAPLDMPVLITGPTGSGKELVAHALHECAPARCEKPLVVVNCGAIPETLIESHLFGHRRGSFTGAVQDQPGLIRQAAGSTLFLDEIGELSPAAQQRLLRFLEDGLVQSIGDTRCEMVVTRVVAATHQRLQEEFQLGRFREDLLYRLNVLPLTLPPLRERLDDIPLLAEHYLQRAAQRNSLPLRKLSAVALAALASHDWPGNVRELKNLMGRLAAWSEVEAISPLELGPLGQPVAHATQPGESPQACASPVPTPLTSGVPEFPRTVEEIQHLRDFRHELLRAYAQHAVRLCGGNVTRAAEALGVDRTSMYTYLGE